ncbi:ABC transporter permease/M1 family aminopeptidase [Pyxidicoccus trucidator]|uniref:ABC transporter permease/M1 family aminopeptidase n=1 Tax=Pyxidicoccus trucidator TaxID=2709662 RepID=UPI0013DCF764|nr:M1 family aminopeptidase [Pyxidicoccus trucidator]
MLGEVLRFEWRYQTRQVAFYVAVAAFLGLAFLFVGTGYGPDNVHINSPHSVMQSMGLLSLFSIFALSLFCANAALRDSEHKMEELVYATSIGKPMYLFARFAGALLAALTVFAVTALGLMLAPRVMAVDPERLGSTEVLRYVWALAVMVLPNLLFAASLLFAISVLTRSALASYIGAVFLYALYFVGSMLGDSPLMAGAAPQTSEAMTRASLLDPFGLSAFFAQTRYWTEHERNTRLLALEGPFLLNRLLWLGVSAGVLGLVYRCFAFRVAAGTKTGRGETSTAAPVSAAYRPVASASGAASLSWAALKSAVGLESRYVLKSGAFLSLLALWVVVVGMDVAAGATRTEYGTQLLPTTGLLLPGLQQALSLIGTLTVVYFGAELVWRERVVGMSALLDATPVSSAVFYLSKLLVLAVLTCVLAATAVGIAVLFQLSRGYHHLEPGLYLSLLYFTGLPLLLFAVAALLLQTLSPNRYVGMFLALLLALVVRQGELVGLEHGLVRFASVPAPRHSDLDGFGAAVGPFSALMVYWSALAGLLGLITCGLWRRGVSPPLRARLAALPRMWGRSGRVGAVACLGVFGVTGAVIFHGTNVLNIYETRSGLADWKADYEKAYQRYETLAQPSVVAVKSTVDLFPSERRYQVAGTYQLENRTSEAIETVWLSVRRDVSLAALMLVGARLHSHDARFGMYAFKLERPLPPGARVELTFAIDVARRGIQVSELDSSIVENGSFITNLEAFPSIGYRKGYELKDARERRKRGLPETPAIEAAAEGDLGLAEGSSARAWTTLETTLSTSEDQLAVAPGVLRKEWRDGGRRYFHYVMDRPMLNYFAFVSARYAVEKVRHRGIDVELYYHPAHAHNVARMMTAATRSLDIFGEQFGPYPHEQLRIVEVPSSWSFGALALSNTIYYPEHRGFLSDASHDGVDLITRRIAHEVAHQWWGHQVDPANGPGAATITEALAKYSEQLVVRATHGEPHLRDVLAFDLDRYLRGRAAEAAEEPPLTEVKDHPYLYYGKGAVVMNALRDLLGETAMNRALRRLVRERAWPNAQPTTRDLLAALHAEAPEAHHLLIDQWLKEVVLYDLKVESATYESLADGRYRVTARIAAAKTARRGGEHVPLELDEELDIGVFSQHPEALSGEDSPLYAAKHRFMGASTEVSVIVNARPVYVGVDPFLRRVELERTDNAVKPVAATQRGGPGD